MRNKLSELVVKEAIKNPKFVVLSGDHGNALFDELRRQRPDQFINCGIAEQSMVGIAAGLARQGYQVVVYGLAAFVPMRVLEQIKLDICFSNLPITIIGDGAGLTYSTLGASHHCAEDIAVLRPLPNIHIYSPCDAEELQASWELSLFGGCPSYIRIGKGDRPPVPIMNANAKREAVILATGSMVYTANEIAKNLDISCASIPRIKPLAPSLFRITSMFKKVIVIEEHSAFGGLYSAIREQAVSPNAMYSIALKPQFADKCGSYQYALSEHDMDDESLMRRVKEIVDAV